MSKKRNNSKQIFNTKNEKIKSFNPNDSALYHGIFGLPFNAEESETVIIPVPWEVTVSYHSGTAKGPQAILEASYQVDLFDPFLKDAWTRGIFLEKIPSNILKKNNLFRKKTEQYIKILEGKTKTAEQEKRKLANEINKACEWLNNEVYHLTSQYLLQDKLVVLLGGDHSTPFGFIKAISEKYSKFSLLHIDAHADLRKAYQGLEYSHASIMYNVVQKISSVEKIVQIGIRDYCEEEYQMIQTHPKISTYFDREIKHALYNGEKWSEICKSIREELGEFIYISFDIDGLDPKLCPNTGTPVAGGFEVEQVLYLFEEIVYTGRKIIGFDLNEVAPAKNHDWDANVAARLLYRMINIAQKSWKK